MGNPEPICEREGCGHVAFGCYLPDDEEPTEFLCGEHAHAAGYCYGCGWFSAGIESFDFGDGLCDTCRSNEDDGDGEDDF